MKFLRVCAALILWACACAEGISPSQPSQSQSSSDRSEAGKRRAAHQLLQEARRLRGEGRTLSAQRACERGIALAPEDAALHRLNAELLAELGDRKQAQAHRERAALLAPPLPPLPRQALDLGTAPLLVILLPPPAEISDEGSRSRTPPKYSAPSRAWPDLELVAALRERVALRLPDAEWHLAALDEPAFETSVASSRDWLSGRAARAVLSLQVERSDCGESIKDGRFAIARIRAAAALRGGPAPAQRVVRDAQSELAADADCRAASVGRALESLLTGEDIRTALVADADTDTDTDRNGDWSSEQLRAVFPALEGRIAQEIASGRRLARTGQLNAAAEHYHRALEIDPDDPHLLALLDDAERSIALSRELSRLAADASTTHPSGPRAETGDLPPALTRQQRLAMERLLLEEKERRRQLLAALEVLEADQALPSDETLAGMRPLELGEPPPRGARLARARVEGPVEASVLYAPDGTLLARYYFAAGAPSSSPAGAEQVILRGDSSRTPNEIDRWVAFERGVQQEVWEAPAEAGAPWLHWVYAEAGSPLLRIELDRQGDGGAEQVFHFEDGRVQRELRDSNGDGNLDLVEYFDADGNPLRREADTDHDGEPDTRTIFQDGRIIRREFLTPATERDDSLIRELPPQPEELP